MRIKSKICIGLITLTALFASTNVFAYQSTPGGSATKDNASNYIKGVRAMEGLYRGMGFSESYDTSTLKATTASNHIDVHMQKATEYGAVLILSSSYYGKHGTGTNESEYITATRTGVLATTTGNVYGIYQIGTNNELTAAGSWYSSALSRYINRYSGSTTYYPGDAITETSGWKGSNAASEFSTPSNALWRNYFKGGTVSATTTDANLLYTSRACVVNSEDENI